VVGFATGGSDGAADCTEPAELSAARHLGTHQISNEAQAPFSLFQQPRMGHIEVEGKTRAAAK
jgi:hypothetical protein